MDLLNSFKKNAVALISLFVAVTALLYTGWREERTERNRTTRVAAFEVLKNLGELQVVVNASYFQKERSADPMMGWGYIALISDLGQLLPAPVPEKVAHLVEVWQSDWSHLKTDQTSVDRVTHEIDASRESVSALLVQLR